MKKSIWLAIIGAAALTGCQNEVMQQREYIPAPREDAEAVRPAATAEPANNEFSAPGRSAQPAAGEQLPTITRTFDNEGIRDDAPARGRGRSAKRGPQAAAGAGTYIVQRGDFPEKIARKHHVSLRALMEANGLDEAGAKRLRVGQKLVIPERGAAPARRRGGKGKRAIGAGPAAAAAPGEYIVKAGDTPEKIARRHHVRLSALMEANNLSEDAAKRLRVGQKLVIPERGGRRAPARRSAGTAVPAAAPESAPAPETAPAPTTRNEVDGGYIADVPEDMSIAEFARLNGTTPEKLRELNPDIPAQVVKGGSYVVPKN